MALPTPAETLGYGVGEWIEEFCCYGPGDLQGEPAVIDKEMLRFIVEAYRVDGTGRRTYDESAPTRRRHGPADLRRVGAV